MIFLLEVIFDTIEFPRQMMVIIVFEILWTKFILGFYSLDYFYVHFVFLAVS